MKKLKRLTIWAGFAVVATCICFFVMLLTGGFDPTEKQQTATAETELKRTAEAIRFLTATAQTWTPIPSPTFTLTLTNTPRPSLTPTIGYSEKDDPEIYIVTPPTQVVTPTWYVTGAQRVNVRSCSSTDCEVVATVNYGDSLTVIGSANNWHEIQLSSGRTGYIASWLTSITKPTESLPTSVPVVQPTQPTQVQPTSAPVGAVSPFGCNGIDDLNCADFKAIGQNANAHLAACGDEDNLDGDGDGRACEN